MTNVDRRPIVRSLAALILATLVLVACGDQAGVVEGTITQAADGKPLAQAEIVVYGLQRAAGAGQGVNLFQKGNVIQREPVAGDGSYRLSLPAGSYVVQVWVGDATVGDRMVEVRAGRQATVDFEVESPNP